MKTGEQDFFAAVADVFGVPPSRLSFETTFASIPEWDSMAHLRLVMDAQSRWGAEIPFAEVTDVTSLWELYRRVNGLSPKKAVVLDLDGTLWDGVVGEDGVDALRPKTAFLAELKALQERGVLLAVCSKNNEEDARAAFGAGLLAPLAADDFVAAKIDWREKADGVLELARELNFGLDAFVFVDDNPAERLAMAARLPEVAVAAFPPMLAAFFPAGGAVTAEDRRKTEEYREEAARRTFLAGKAISKDELWAALGCWLDVHRLRPEEAARVAQLSQKANQFSVCTNRYGEAEVSAMGRGEGGREVFVARAGDRFGDQGLVAFVVVAEGGELLDFTMSCRVAGRGLEERVAEAVFRELRARGVRELRATWRRTAKNAPVRDLFERLGFACVRETPDERRYERKLEIS